MSPPPQPATRGQRYRAKQQPRERLDRLPGDQAGVHRGGDRTRKLAAKMGGVDLAPGFKAQHGRAVVQDHLTRAPLAQAAK